VESRRVSKEPGGYDAADGRRDKRDGDRSRAAVMWLHVVRSPRGEAGGNAINAYDLEVQCTVISVPVFRTKEDGVTRCSDKRAEHSHQPAALVFITEVGGDDGENEGASEGRDR